MGPLDPAAEAGGGAASPARARVAARDSNVIPTHRLIGCEVKFIDATPFERIRRH
jgi:hypothetical protein